MLKLRLFDISVVVVRPFKISTGRFGLEYNLFQVLIASIYVDQLVSHNLIL